MIITTRKNGHATKQKSFYFNMQVEKKNTKCL